VWIFGLFHSSAHRAGAPHPLAEQTDGSASSVISRGSLEYLAAPDFPEWADELFLTTQ
jgi:hypothetical protein